MNLKTYCFQNYKIINGNYYVVQQQVETFAQNYGKTLFNKILLT